MKTFRITLWDNGDQHFDARNPSKRLLEMEVTVHASLMTPKMPLLQALRAMYPSTDVEIFCSEVVTTSKEVECPVIK